MAYQVELTARARNSTRRLTASPQSHSEALALRANDPGSAQVKALTGQAGLFRIRVAVWRVSTESTPFACSFSLSRPVAEAPSIAAADPSM